MRRIVFGWCVLAALLPSLRAPAAPPGAPVFGRDILPLFSDRCFACHGPDSGAGQGKLRLDGRESALLAGGSGRPAIVPGRPERSELLRRVTLPGGGRMPPAGAHKKALAAAEVDLVRRWIQAGAPWGRHWAFEKPVRAPVPIGAKHPVDGFVRSRLAAAGLRPAGPAPRHTLLRRLSVDLTGLPPTPEETTAFLADSAPDAIERVIDRLLRSPHFGERMAMWWLDMARYSDTDGYQADETRTNWPWRDWVVQAFNSGMPFDRFTLEQFAGDLLPHATPEQRLATCFHRNHMTNGEGGRDPEESRIDYVIDRINTVGSVWLGLTLNCCQCHSHKFDPISQADYYSLAAFFNSIDEDGKAGRAAKPYLSYQSPAAGRAVDEAQALVEQRRQRAVAARSAADEGFDEWLRERRGRLAAGAAGWRIPAVRATRSVEGSVLTADARGTITALGPNPRQDDYRVTVAPNVVRLTGIRLEVLRGEGGAFSRGKDGEFLLTDVKAQVRRPGSTQVKDLLLSGAVADFSTDKGKNGGYGDVRDTLDDDPRNGWSTRGAPRTEVHTAVYALAVPYAFQPGEELIFELRHRSTLGDANLARFRVALTDEGGDANRTVGPTPLEAFRATGLGTPDGPLKARLMVQYLEGLPAYAAEKLALERAEAQLAEVGRAAGKVEVMVLAERAQSRETHVLIRGVWDKRGARVERGVPPAIAPWPSADTPATRAGLAAWLTSPENPLTARVIVNHVWQLLFGAGLVRTPEDFGLQGERPTHPELLDWLAVEFRESGWDLRRLIRLIVTSETYRQSSVTTPELRERDPENRLLARAPRYRLPAWVLRDAALRYGGLLNPAVGGPPVRPYQPEGVWEENFMGRFRYEPSEGAAQHRRTLYAFWRRSVAPTFLFDSAQRRVCEVRQPRTNTPLQALTLLNDGTQLEAAGALARRVPAGSPEERIAAMARTVLGRDPTARELGVYLREWKRAARHYESDPGAAVRFLASGRVATVAAHERAATAASMLTAGMILNLDETLTHE